MENTGDTARSGDDVKDREDSGVATKRARLSTEPEEVVALTGAPVAAAVSTDASCASERDASPTSIPTTTATPSSAAPAPNAVAVVDPAQSQNFCAICLEGPSESKALLDTHKCKRCLPTAWRVCEACEDTLLSRRCPICHGDYGSIEYYAFVDVATNTGDDEVAGMATSLLARVKVKVIAASNVMIWCPGTRQLMFSLPMDTSVPKHEVQYLKSSISASDAISVSGSTFSFTNRVWDAMEAAEEATEVMGVREMLAWVLQTLSNPENVLFTSLTQDQIIELMREAVRSSHTA